MDNPLQITNKTFDEINLGDKASYVRLVTEREVQLFAAVSGDHNPVHLDPELCGPDPIW